MASMMMSSSAGGRSWPIPGTMTSYNGQVFFGLNADRDGVGDVDVLADLIEQEVGELVESAS